MTRSQNGWPAYDTTAHYKRWAVGDFGYWAANDDVGLVFHEFLTRFVAEVEKLELSPLQCWSWANRLIRGSTSTVSNHGSATALDLNSLKHQRGVKNTFAPGQRLVMHKIRDSIVDDAGRPVLRLGMDYSDNVLRDDMHVEIDAGPIAVAQAARRIKARRREEAEMQLDDKVDLTPKAEDLTGDKTETVAMLLQWPPAVRAARNEIAALEVKVDKLATGIAELKALLTPKTGK